MSYDKRKYGLQWYADNKKSVLKKIRDLRETDPRKFLYARARSRALKYQVPFDIRVSDIIIPERCPILDIPLKVSTGRPAANSPSLDRRIPKLGYVKGNIEVISFRANTIKQDATAYELLAIAEWLLTISPDNGDSKT